MSESHIGIIMPKRTKEHTEKLRQCHIGRKHTKIARKNMSKAHIGKTASDETRKKMSAAAKLAWKKRKQGNN
jgi:hypothetical protein